MRFQSYFNHALAIIEGYDGRSPLSHHLKQYFAAHKKHGSTDRKMIAHACYSFYRLGHALKDRAPAGRLKAALFLCTADLEKWRVVFDADWLDKPDWLSHAGGIEKADGRSEQTEGERNGHRGQEVSDLNGRLARIREFIPSFSVTDIFPWKDELSEGIDHDAFCRSFLRQPDLFIRIRPGHEQTVRQKLAGQTAEFIPPFTLRLPNGFKIEECFTPDKEIVVQDYSSQRLAPFLQIAGADAGTDNAADTRSTGAVPALWDACAASGGKSILAHDLHRNLKITVSDIRESILHNLARRFHQAGITNYHSFVADLTTAGSLPSPSLPPFDLIIADVPCSGSGTWARTPEELYFFDPSKIGVYRKMQEQIVSNLIPHLGEHASLVYSTCSVFKRENEEMAAFIEASLGLRPDRVEIIKGMEERADSMFAARFIS